MIREPSLSLNMISGLKRKKRSCGEQGSTLCSFVFFCFMIVVPFGVYRINGMVIRVDVNY